MILSCIRWILLSFKAIHCNLWKLASLEAEIAVLEKYLSCQKDAQIPIWYWRTKKMWKCSNYKHKHNEYGYSILKRLNTAHVTFCDSVKSKQMAFFGHGGISIKLFVLYLHIIIECLSYKFHTYPILTGHTSWISGLLGVKEF